jgi:DNA polymerase III subunit delta'
MSLGSLVGQDRVSGLLRRMVETERIPPAVLICGPVGSGKTAAAFALGRALLCSGDRASAPCETCDNCNRTRMMSHPDLHAKLPMKSVKGKPPPLVDQQARALEAARDPYGYALPEPNDNIAIDTIRDVIKEFSRASFQGGRRIAIVLRATQMVAAGANAMLKTLEEPPENATMVLTASSLDSLLPTIVSRCQLFRLGPASKPELTSYIVEQRGSSHENAEFVAGLSGGNVREALSLASDEAHATQDRAFRFLTALATGKDSQTFLALEQLAAEKAVVFDILKSTEVWLRDVLQYRLAGPEHIVNKHRLADVEQLANGVTNETIEVLAQQIERVREMNRRNINLQLSLTELWRKTRAAAPIGSF